METQPTIRTGTLVRWFKDRGFGFIAPDSAGQDVFVHRLDVIGEIPVGSSVQYELATFGGKTKAAKVRAVAPAGVQS